MKRKNIILKNNLYLSVTGIIVFLLFIFFANNGLQDTIGNVYYQSIQETMLTVQNKILSERRLQGSYSELKEDIPDDMVVLLLEGKEIVNLNPELHSKELLRFVENYLLVSNEGHDLMEQHDSVLKKVVYRDERNFPRSFYLSLSSLDEKNQQKTLLLGKDSSVWDAYLLRSKVVFFLLILVYLALIFYFHHQQQKKVYEPIKEMTDVAFHYSENNFERSISFHSQNEIGELATALNKIGKTMEASNLINIKEKKLLRLVFDSLSVGVIYLDEDLTITSLNTLGEHYRTVYIKTAGENQQKEIVAKYQEMIEAVTQTGSGKRIEVQYIQSIYDIRFSPLFDEDGDQVKGILLVIEDITEAKRLASIREDLITNVSHDFRTPLATIKGYSEAIIDDIAESLEEKNEMAKIIFDEANELNKTINSLLSLSRMKAGHAELQLETVPLEPFFMHTISRFTDTFKQTQITCSFNIQDNLDYYQMDEEKMSHVIYNLIDNAVRYSADKSSNKEKYINIEVKLDTVLDEILFTITDNGIGISEESIPYIFDRFFKDDKARTKPKQNGTGIGLSLVQSIVKEHSGKVEVESKIEEGTTFTIRLPYKDTFFEEVEEEERG